MVHLSLLNRNLLPGLESLGGTLLSSLKFLRGRLGHLAHELLGGRVVQVDPLSGLGVLELTVDEVLHSGDRGGQRGRLESGLEDVGTDTL